MIGQIEPYVIGKRYLVPMVMWSYRGEPERWWPVLGSFHNDVEDIGVSDWHFHIDYRFLSRKHLRIGRDTDFRGSSIPFAYRNIMTFEEKPETSIKWRKCRRLYPERYPVPEVRWMAALQQRYEGKQLTDDMKCPHRGASLVGLAPDADGCVACPLHGLKWNCETKRLVKHKTKERQ